MNEKKSSQIFAVLAVLLTVVSVPFYFVLTFKGKVNGSDSDSAVTILTLFQQGSSATEGETLTVLALILMVALLLSVAGAVLTVFNLKGAKIAGLVLFVLNIFMNAFVTAYICTATSAEWQGLVGTVGMNAGIIVVLSAMALATVFATVSLVLFCKEEKEMIKKTREDYSFESINIEAYENSGVANNSAKTKEQWAQPPVNAGANGPGVTFLAGSLHGYRVPLSQNSIVIGKDPAQCSVIIDDSYSAVSRRHCEISYNTATGNYTVTDYSVNGVFDENGSRLIRNVKTTLSSGTVLTLAKTDNIFRLD